MFVQHSVMPTRWPVADASATGRLKTVAAFYVPLPGAKAEVPRRLTTCEEIQIVSCDLFSGVTIGS